MKLYSEDEAGRVRLRFEEEVLGWPQVTTKKMFGCPGYQATGTLFAFLVTQGVVLTKLSPETREGLGARHQTEPFGTGDRVVKKWIVALVDEETDWDGLLSFVKESYQGALTEG
ncbi:MAG: TfoX/Sxy family protein [Thermoplasmata archaeon]